MTTNAGTTRKPSRKRAAPPESNDSSESVEIASDGDSREEMIATAAYYRAEQRGFSEGGDVEDWLAAEEEVERYLSNSGLARMADYP